MNLLKVDRQEVVKCETISMVLYIGIVVGWLQQLVDVCVTL